MEYNFFISNSHVYKHEQKTKVVTGNMNMLVKIQDYPYFKLSFYFKNSSTRLITVGFITKVNIMAYL